MVSQWGYSGQSCHAQSLTTWRNGNEKWHVRLSEAKQQILQVSGMIAADPVSKSQPNLLTFQFCYTDLHCGQPAHTQLEQSGKYCFLIIPNMCSSDHPVGWVSQWQYPCSSYHCSLELEQPDELHSALLRRHLFSALTKVRNIQTFICHNFVFIMQNKASAGGEVSLTNYSCLVILSYPSRVLFY